MQPDESASIGPGGIEILFFAVGFGIDSEASIGPGGIEIGDVPAWFATLDELQLDRVELK